MSHQPTCRSLIVVLEEEVDIQNVITIMEAISMVRGVDTVGSGETTDDDYVNRATAMKIAIGEAQKMIDRLKEIRSNIADY